MFLSAAAIRDLEATLDQAPVVGLARDLSTNTYVEPHAHDRGQLMFCSSGVMVIESVGSTWVAPPRRAVWVPIGVRHSFMPTTRIALRNLLLLPEVETRLPSACCFVEINPLLRELIIRIAEGSALKSALHADRVARLLIDEMEPCPIGPLFLPEARDPRAKRICDAIKSNPADRRTLDDWSLTVGASSRTLTRLFIRETGLSFANWRRQARLVRAAIMLGLGHSVTSVALDSGYESPSAFIEMFHRCVGLTPKQYVMGC